MVSAEASVPPAVGDGQEGRSQSWIVPCVPWLPEQGVLLAPAKGFTSLLSLYRVHPVLLYWVRDPSDLAMLGQKCFGQQHPQLCQAASESSDPEGKRVTSPQWL